MQFSLLPINTLASRHLRFAPLWLCVGLGLILCISFMSVVSVPAEVKKFLMHDKLLHVAAYGLLMGWFAQIFRRNGTRLLLAIGFVLMGIGIEYIQGQVPSRQFEVLDMIANTSGIVLAWALAYTWMGRALEWFENTCLSWVPRAATDSSASLA